MKPLSWCANFAIWAVRARFGLTVAHMNLHSIFRAVAVVGFGALCAPTVAHAQRGFSIGPDIGYTYLLDSKTRNAFGSSVTDLGVGFGTSEVNPAVNGRIGLDLSILRPKEDSAFGQNKALVIFAGPQFSRVVGLKTVNDLTRVLPYYGTSLNAVYAQVETPFNGRDSNGFGGAVSVFAGVAFSRRVYVEGRVRAATKVEGYNFSNAGVTLGVRF